MAEAEVKKVESESPAPAPAATPVLASVDVVAPKDVPEEKAVAVVPPPPAEEKVDDTKLALAAVEKTPDSAEKIKKKDSLDRDVALANVETEKRMSFIKAWEESEKSKVDNKAQKKLSAVASWENSKKATLEANLRQMEEKLEKKKAEYAERMKNKVALIHKEAEEKRAMIEAQRGEDLLKAEEMSAKYRATGQVPKKLFGCF